MNHNETHRILMATDIPFWNAKTGAEQRMLSLAQFFNMPPFELAIFFLGRVTPQDHQRITDRNLRVTFFESERPPDAFLARMKWYADATRHQLRKWVSRERTEDQEKSEQPPEPLRLADYQWPWATDQFRRKVERFRPHTIVCQYITMAYLVASLPARERREIHCVLDTHDILHERGMQFGAAGYLHWLDIGRDEEISTWNLFDTILAIQENEAELIRQAVSGPTVMTVGHAPLQEDLPGDDPDEMGRGKSATVGGDSHAVDKPVLTLGYIGSANYSNWHALNRFLLEVWPDLVSLEGIEVRLQVAGKLCDWFQALAPSRVQGLAESRVNLMGEVEQLRDFYREIDIAINPVQFGTGLKIKNVEALRFGKPLVTTESGASGMSIAARQACRVVTDFRGMSSELVELCRNPESREGLARQAFLHANHEYSQNSTYGELAAQLLKSAKTSSGSTAAR